MSQHAHYSGYSVGAHDRGARAGSPTSVTAAPLTIVMLDRTPLLTKRARQVLWLDAAAGAIAGIALLTFRERLATLFGFAIELVLFNAVANLSYASYSATLASLTALDIEPPRRGLVVLVAANAAWTAVCLTILSQTWSSGSVIGLGYVALEGLFVALLALAEYRVLLRVARA